MSYFPEQILAALSFDWQQFLRPQFLWWAMPAAILCTAAALYFDALLASRDLRRYGNPEHVCRFSRLPKLADRLFTTALLCLVSASLVVAAAGPYEQVAPVQVPAGSLRVVYVQDTSRSAAIEDARNWLPLYGGPDCALVAGPCGNRVQVGLAVLINQIMPAIEHSSLGLVSYATYATVHSYLNYDFAPLHLILKDLDWVKVGSGHGFASNITEGLKAAQKVFERNGPRKQGVQDVIVLASDGGFSGNERDLDAQLMLLENAGYRLIVLGLGNSLPSPIPVYEADGRLKGQFLSGNLQRDEAFLNRLTEKAGGKYIALSPGKPLDIDWPSTLAGKRMQLQMRNLYGYPVALAMLLLTVLWLKRLTVRLWHSSERSRSSIAQPTRTDGR
jgi:hypothetical protein